MYVNLAFIGTVGPKRFNLQCNSLCKQSNSGWHHTQHKINSQKKLLVATAAIREIAEKKKMRLNWIKKKTDKWCPYKVWSITNSFVAYLALVSIYQIYVVLMNHIYAKKIVKIITLKCIYTWYTGLFLLGGWRKSPTH